MNTRHRLTTLTLFVAILAAAPLLAQEPSAQPAPPVAAQPAPPETIALDPPRLDAGLPIMQALKNRHSGKEFADTKLTKQQLSEVLWAADGVNREDGHRTAPSAMSKYPIDIYAVLEEGIYLYNPAKHELTPVAQGDFRKQSATQDYAHTAPLNLVYVADFEKFSGVRDTSPEKMTEWACMESGAQAQNVYLYCASEGLASVFRVSIDKEQFGKAINVRPSQSIIAAQTVGHAK